MSRIGKLYRKKEQNLVTVYFNKCVTNYMNISTPPKLHWIIQVPLGFVCGYPLAGGELYGGSMFIKSAANDTLQGKAIHSINERWGKNRSSKNWIGTETIGIPVCKKKYAPFEFKKRVLKDGRVHVEAIRLYGCVCHSHLREKVIKKFGPRKGWEPFGQWSMKKAQLIARKLSDDINAVSSVSESSSGDEDSSSDSDHLRSPTPMFDLKRLCHNGRCIWKMKHKYDDICEEIREKDEIE